MAAKRAEGQRSSLYSPLLPCFCLSYYPLNEKKNTETPTPALQQHIFFATAGCFYDFTLLLNTIPAGPPSTPTSTVTVWLVLAQLKEGSGPFSTETSPPYLGPGTIVRVKRLGCQLYSTQNSLSTTGNNSTSDSIFLCSVMFAGRQQIT